MTLFGVVEPLEVWPGAGRRWRQVVCYLEIRGLRQRGGQLNEHSDRSALEHGHQPTTPLPQHAQAAPTVPTPAHTDPSISTHSSMRPRSFGVVNVLFRMRLSKSKLIVLCFTHTRRWCGSYRERCGDWALVGGASHCRAAYRGGRGMCTRPHHAPGGGPLCVGHKGKARRADSTAGHKDRPLCGCLWQCGRGLRREGARMGNRMAAPTC